LVVFGYGKKRFAADPAGLLKPIKLRGEICTRREHIDEELQVFGMRYGFCHARPRRDIAPV
jgi:hypothetical protein